MFTKKGIKYKNLRATVQSRVLSTVQQIRVWFVNLQTLDRFSLLVNYRQLLICMFILSTVVKTVGINMIEWDEKYFKYILREIQMVAKLLNSMLFKHSNAVCHIIVA